MLSDAQLLCRVCGLRQEEPPWGEDGRSPTYEYCACCGTEFGYQDASLTGILRQRERWLREGASWAEPDKKPPDWDLDAQLAQIPPEWRAEASNSS